MSTGPAADRLSLPVRLASAVGGALLLIPALLLFWLPEAGIPLAITALGLMGRQFRWALDAQAQLMVRATEGTARFAALPMWAKFLVCIAFAAVIVAVIALVFGR